MNDGPTYPIEITKEELRKLIWALRDELGENVKCFAFEETYRLVDRMKRIDALRANYSRLP